jgi:hypothetical protein
MLPAVFINLLYQTRKYGLFLKMGFLFFKYVNAEHKDRRNRIDAAPTSPQYSFPLKHELPVSLAQKLPFKELNRVLLIMHCCEFIHKTC